MLVIMLQVLQVQMQPLDNVKPVPEDDSDSNNNNIESLSRVLYDQRQTGKYNIHVSIKDVAIIEADQNELADVSESLSLSISLSLFLFENKFRVASKCVRAKLTSCQC